MKKLMIAVAALSAGVAFADTSAITSANVVGYTSKACTKGTWYMIGCGFEKTSGGSMDIQDFITGLTARASANDPAFIQVWNGTSLDTYYYSQAYDSSWAIVNGWVKAGDYMLATLEIKPGFSCWFMEPANDVTLTIAGQVVTATTSNIAAGQEAWTMVANPYPVATALNDGLIDWSNFTARESSSTPDFIQFWNGTSLDTYYYSQAYDSSWAIVNGWVKAGDYLLTDFTIPVGTGFWFYSYTGGNIIFKKTAE